MRNFKLKPFNIYGISKELPETLKYFKEFKTEEIFYINNDKHKILDLLAINVKVDNIDVEIFNTIKSVSDDGRRFTGYKIFITGSVISNIEYSSNNYNKSIRNIKINSEFSTYVTLSKEFNISKEVKPSVYIEDINMRFLDGYHLKQSMLMLVDIDTI